MSSQLELRYLEGVALWRERDLEEAVAVLELVWRMAMRPMAMDGGIPHHVPWRR